MGTEYLLLAGAAFLAGVMNALAGGGTFITFPALVFTGVPSVIANASNAVALVPASFASAWAYRRDFQNVENLSFKSMVAVSLVGGVIGAVLLVSTPETTFDALVPWLLLAATLVFAFGPKFIPKLRERFHIGPATLLFLQFCVGIYGGYFGGAMGIVMLAVYSLFGLTNLNAMNAMKAMMAGFINGVSVFVFVFTGNVVWKQTLFMMVFAIIGGYFGAHYGRKLNPKYLRALIILISSIVTIVFFVRL
ncbi:MAG: sulfite exporter TauE/SafE family protein [Proteobacteria bacterium]|nr:sulfite exporter TauE/SafE family protein [Pseudomonadota bacterium]